MKMRSMTLPALALAIVMLALGDPASAGEGLTQSQLEDAGWACSPVGGLPPGHCVSPGSGKNAAQGKFATAWNIMVFDAAGDFESAETATTNQRAANRPCKFDDDSPDGTWWSPGIGPTGEPLYVCHHR